MRSLAEHDAGDRHGERENRARIVGLFLPEAILNLGMKPKETTKDFYSSRSGERDALPLPLPPQQSRHAQAQQKYGRWFRDREGRPQCDWHAVVDKTALPQETESL